MGSLEGHQVMVLYHAGCVDGFTAAWAVWRGLGRKPVELVPVSYGKPPPEVADRKVYIVDFSYPREVLEQMNIVAVSLIVLDHHKTAKKELAGLPYCKFDMSLSGASLAWSQFSIEAPPRLVRYVQDRDLWLHREVATHEINAYIRSWPFDLETWDALATQLKDGYSQAVVVGRAILRQTKADRDQLLHSNLRLSGLDGMGPVPVINACQFGVSDLLHDVIEDGPHEALQGFKVVWALAWWQRKDGLFQYSLRSSADGPDVSEIAESFGGGGHRNAAGFESQELLV